MKLKVYLIFFFSSQSNGNSLFSALSIYLVGNSKLVNQLRVLVCLELFLNSNFYASHPSLQGTYNANTELFSDFQSLFFMSLSNGTADLGLANSLLIEEEAKVMCVDNVLPSFICVLAFNKASGLFALS